MSAVMLHAARPAARRRRSRPCHRSRAAAETGPRPPAPLSRRASPPPFPLQDLSPHRCRQAAATPEQEQAAGLKESAKPALKEVTAACEGSLAHDAAAGQHAFVDFAHVKAQLPIARVLEHLNLARKLHGAGAQKRCACPIHRPDSRGRTFSVNLDDNVFQCFASSCQKKGDVIDLWAALHHQDLRQAALDLVHTFALEPAPTKPTEMRHG
jgi:CHC2-type zinc finger protein